MRPVATDIAWPVCTVSVTTVSCAKTAESIEMPFGMSTRVGPGSLRGGERCSLSLLVLQQLVTNRTYAHESVADRLSGVTVIKSAVLVLGAGIAVEHVRSFAARFTERLRTAGRRHRRTHQVRTVRHGRRQRAV